MGPMHGNLFSLYGVVKTNPCFLLLAATLAKEILIILVILNWKFMFYTSFIPGLWNSSFFLLFVLDTALKLLFHEVNTENFT